MERGKGAKAEGAFMSRHTAPAKIYRRDGAGLLRKERADVRCKQIKSEAGGGKDPNLVRDSDVD
jgi:hypothetical protein